MAKTRVERGDTRRIVALAVVLKLLVLWLGIQAAIVFTNEALPSPHSWLEIWNRWDAPHYLDLIDHGYSATGEERYWIVFFPLFPWIARGFKVLLGDPLASAFFVSTIASVAAAVLLYRLARLEREEGNESDARDAVWFLFIFPTAYFLHIGYTESLFLALVLASFLAARRGKWAAAGIIGAFASLARVNGLLLVPALAMEALVEYRRTRKFNAAWLWIALAGLGFLGYLFLNKHVTGDFFTFQRHQREHWNRALAMPWVSIGQAWTGIWVRTPADSIMVGWQELLFTLLAIAATVWAAIRSRASYAVWCGLNVLLWTSTGLLLSAPRYALTVFPMFFWFARSRGLTRAALTAWSLLWLGVFVSVFVQGKWAF
jgi:Gpi18-like mannosyltransferase